MSSPTQSTRVVSRGSLQRKSKSIWAWSPNLWENGTPIPGSAVTSSTDSSTRSRAEIWKVPECPYQTFTHPVSVSPAVGSGTVLNEPTPASIGTPTQPPPSRMPAMIPAIPWAWASPPVPSTVNASSSENECDRVMGGGREGLQRRTKLAQYEILASGRQGSGRRGSERRLELASRFPYAEASLPLDRSHLVREGRVLEYVGEERGPEDARVDPRR